MEKLILIILSAIVGYFFANTKFVAERWWDKKYETYISSLDILHEIENAMLVLEWAAEHELHAEESDLVTKSLNDYSNGITKLHSMQNKMLMLNMKDEHFRLMKLVASLSVVQPFHFSKDSGETAKDIHDLVRQTKGLCSGCSGEIAFLGRKALKEKVNFFAKLVSYFNGS